MSEAEKETPPAGLGDKVAAITEALGIEKKPDCGCDKRQRALNKVRTNQKPWRVVKDIVRAVLKP